MKHQKTAHAAQSVLSALIVAWSLAAPAAAAETAAQAFEKLRSLAGEWEGRMASGRTLRVSYRLSAAGSVLVETWAPGTEHESLTLYHLDDDRLLATHYCLQGNQPRLQLAPQSAADTYTFSFRDATNLASPADTHRHQLELKLDSAEVLHRKDIYLEAGKPDVQQVVFTRLRAP